MSNFRGPGSQLNNTAQSPLDFTDEYKRISTNLSSLLAPNLQESNRNDLVDEIFIILHSTKSRELLLHLLQNALLFYIVQHHPIRDSIVKRTGYWQSQFLKLYLNDPLSSETLASVLPISANNGAIHGAQENGNGIIPLSSIAKDVSARFVPGTMDVDAGAAHVIAQMHQGTESLVAAVKAAAIIPSSSDGGDVSTPAPALTAVTATTSTAPTQRLASLSSVSGSTAGGGNGLAATTPSDDSTETASVHSDTNAPDTNPVTTTILPPAPSLAKAPSVSTTTIAATTATAPSKPSRPFAAPRSRHHLPPTGLQSEYHPSTQIIAKRIPVLSLQPLSTSSQQYWLIERQITQVLSGIFSLLFYHCLHMYLSFAANNTSIDHSKKVAHTFREITFDALLMALEELYGWEEHSVVILRSLLYTFLTTLTTKVNDIVRETPLTTTFTCCLSEIGNFIEEFVFLRPTGHQTYLSSVRFRSTFLSSLRLGEDVIAKCFRSQHSTATSASMLARIVPEHPESIPQGIYLSHLATNGGGGVGGGSSGGGGGSDKKDSHNHHLPRPFGLHFDANGAQDLPLVERYVYLLLQLGWASTTSQTSLAAKIAGKLTSSSSQQQQQHPCPSVVNNLYPKPQGYSPVIPVSERAKYLQQQQQQSGELSTNTNHSLSSKAIQEARRSSGMNLPSINSSSNSNSNNGNGNANEPRRSSLPTESLSYSNHGASYTYDSFRSSSNNLNIDLYTFQSPGQGGSANDATTTTTVGALGPSSFQHTPEITPDNTLPSHRFNIPQTQRIHLDVVKKESRDSYNALTKLMSLQFSFFSVVAKCLNDVFTLPTLPTTALNVPYANTYTDSLFKTVTPPQHELLMSKMLLDTVPSAFATNMLTSKHVVEAYLDTIPNPITVEQVTEVARQQAQSQSQSQSQPQQPQQQPQLHTHHSLPPAPPSLHRPYSASSNGSSGLLAGRKHSQDGKDSLILPSMKLHASVTLPSGDSHSTTGGISHPHMDASSSSISVVGVPPAAASGAHANHTNHHHQVIDHLNAIDTNPLLHQRPNQVYSHPPNTTGTHPSIMVGGVPAIAYNNPHYSISPLPGGGMAGLPIHPPSTQLVSDTEQMTPSGAVYSRGVAVNPGLDNVYSILIGSVATHDSSNVTTNTMAAVRMNIGNLASALVNRPRFIHLAKDIPILLNDQLKIMLTRRRAAYLGHSSLIMNEIYHTGDLKWRSEVDPSSVNTPGWAPLVVPSHHIPLAVNSSHGVYSHGVWTPVTIPSIHTAGSDPSTEEVIRSSVYGAAQRGIQATAQHVLMPLSMNVDYQSSIRRHLPSAVTAAFTSTRETIDEYCEHQQVLMKQQLAAYHQQLCQEHNAVLAARERLQYKEKELHERELEIARAQQQLQYQQQFGTPAPVVPHPSLYNSYSHSGSINSSTNSQPSAIAASSSVFQNPHVFLPSATTRQQRGGGSSSILAQQPSSLSELPSSRAPSTLGGYNAPIGLPPTIPQRPQRSKANGGNNNNNTNGSGSGNGNGNGNGNGSPRTPGNTPKLPAKNVDKLSMLTRDASSPRHRPNGNGVVTVTTTITTEQTLTIPPPPPPFSDSSSPRRSPVSPLSLANEITTHVVGGEKVDNAGGGAGGAGAVIIPASLSIPGGYANSPSLPPPSDHIGGVMSINDNDDNDGEGNRDEGDGPTLSHPSKPSLPPMLLDDGDDDDGDGDDDNDNVDNDDDDDDDDDIDEPPIPSSPPPPPPPPCFIPYECQTPLHLRSNHHHFQRGTFPRDAPISTTPTPTASATATTTDNPMTVDDDPFLSRFASLVESCESGYSLPSYAPEAPPGDVSEALPSSDHVGNDTTPTATPATMLFRNRSRIETSQNHSYIDDGDDDDDDEVMVVDDDDDHGLGPAYVASSSHAVNASNTPQPAQPAHPTHAFAGNIVELFQQGNPASPANATTHAANTTTNTTSTTIAPSAPSQYTPRLTTSRDPMLVPSSPSRYFNDYSDADDHYASQQSCDEDTGSVYELSQRRVLPTMNDRGEMFVSHSTDDQDQDQDHEFTLGSDDDLQTTPNTLHAAHAQRKHHKARFEAIIRGGDVSVMSTNTHHPNGATSGHHPDERETTHHANHTSHSPSPTGTTPTPTT